MTDLNLHNPRQSMIYLYLTNYQNKNKDSKEFMKYEITNSNLHTKEIMSTVKNKDEVDKIGTMELVTKEIGKMTLHMDSEFRPGQISDSTRVNGK